MARPRLRRWLSLEGPAGPGPTPTHPFPQPPADPLLKWLLPWLGRCRGHAEATRQPAHGGGLLPGQQRGLAGACLEPGAQGVKPATRSRVCRDPGCLRRSWTRRATGTQGMRGQAVTPRLAVTKSPPSLALLPKKQGSGD